MSRPAGTSAVTSVLLIEDHVAFAQALSAVISLEGDLEVVGLVTDAGKAGATAAGTRPEVGVVDLDLPGGGGTAAIRSVREVSPDTRFLVLTALRHRLELGRVVELGIHGLLHKSADVPQVLDGIRRVAAGENLLSPGLLTTLLGDLHAARRDGWYADATRERLSPREIEVLGELAQGRTVQEIAGSLRIRPETVETHLRNARAKLGATSRLEAVVEAIRTGLVAPPSVNPGELPDFG